MLTGPIQSLVMLAVIVVFYIIDFFLTRRFDRLRKEGGTGRSWSYTLMGLAFAALLIAQPTFLPQIGLRIQAAWALWLQILGVGLCVFGLALNLWSRLHLAQFYTEGAEYQEGHRVIDTGPYHYVRHPVFVSFFCLVIGLLLVNPSIPMLLIAIYNFADFIPAARRDEQLLAANMPEYADYMKRTPAFIPRLIR